MTFGPHSPQSSRQKTVFYRDTPLDCIALKEETTMLLESKVHQQN